MMILGEKGKEKKPQRILGVLAHIFLIFFWFFRLSEKFTSYRSLSDSIWLLSDFPLVEMSLNWMKRILLMTASPPPTIFPALIELSNERPFPIDCSDGLQTILSLLPKSCTFLPTEQF